MPGCVAACGETPWPQITCWRRLAALCRMIGASPPGPFRCGSATCRVKAAATAASKALPPRSSTAMPTWLASQCVLATTPNVPAISGRVVNMRHALLVARSSGRLCDDCVQLKWPGSWVATSPPLGASYGRPTRDRIRWNDVVVQEAAMLCRRDPQRGPEQRTITTRSRLRTEIPLCNVLKQVH